MKLDTGAEVDVMPKRVYDQVTSEDKLQTTTLKLHGYGGDNIPILGSMQMKCKYKNTIKYVDFFVLETNSRTVLSLQACQAMGLVKLLHEVKDADKQLDKKRREPENDWRRVKNMKTGEEMKIINIGEEMKRMKIGEEMKRMKTGEEERRMYRYSALKKTVPLKRQKTEFAYNLC